MDQGFAPTTIAKNVHNVHAPHSSPVMSARGALRTPHAPTKQDKAIAAAEGVRSVFSMPVFAGFIVGIPLSIGGWVAKKMGRERSQALLGGVSEAISQGPRTTTNANALHLPADMLHMVATKAETVGGRAAPMAESLAKRSEALHAGADRLGASLGKVFGPVRAFVGNALGAVNLREPAKKALSFGGRLPVGAGIMAIASTAGIASILMKRDKTSKEHAQTLEDMRGVFGANSPLVTEAAKRYTKEKSRSIVSSTLECANEVAFVGFEAVTTAGMGTFAAMMAGQMGLQSAQQMFVVENPTADAFAGLKMAEQGKEAPAAQKAFWFQSLLGALPEAQAKGGVRNHLAAAGGQLLAERGTTVEQFAALVNNPTKLNGLLTEASERLEAAKAAKAAAKTAPAAKAHVASVPAKTVAAHPVMHAAAPAAKVTDIHHQGPITAHQLNR